MFAIKNDTERYLWAGWLTFVFVSSLLGDSLILIASIKYKAFSLHKMIVAFIQHMAVNDLLHSVGSLAPAAISAIYNSASPRRYIDHVRFFISYYTIFVSSLYISALTLGKLLLLKYPLKLRPISNKHIHKLCAGIWAVCTFVPALHLGIDKDDVIFDYRVYVCLYQYTADVWKILLPIFALFIFMAPGIIVVVSTVLILREARKVVRRTQENLRWQGITTVVLTASVYTIVFLPNTIYFMAGPFVEKNPHEPGIFFLEFYRVAAGIFELSILSNFFIYSLTVTSFRRFLVTKFHQIFSVCLKISSPQGIALRQKVQLIIEKLWL